MTDADHSRGRGGVEETEHLAPERFGLRQVDTGNVCCVRHVPLRSSTVLVDRWSADHRASRTRRSGAPIVTSQARLARSAHERFPRPGTRPDVSARPFNEPARSRCSRRSAGAQPSSQPSQARTSRLVPGGSRFDDNAQMATFAATFRRLFRHPAHDAWSVSYLPLVSTGERPPSYAAGSVQLNG